MIVNSIYKSSYLVNEDIFESFKDTFKDFNPRHINDSHAIRYGYKSKKCMRKHIEWIYLTSCWSIITLKTNNHLNSKHQFQKLFYLNQKIF